MLRRLIAFARNLAAVQAGDAGAAVKASQIQLALRYRELARTCPDALPSIRDIGFRAFSQTDEDGILLYVLAFTDPPRIVVEICCGNGRECNAANLIVNHGWRGLLVDGDSTNIARARRFYAQHPDTRILPPTIVQAWVERESVNDLITTHGFGNEIGLLSIDMDGNDYWIWEAIDVVTPRVVIIEFQNIWPADRAVVVPYRSAFRISAEHPAYFGASLGALVKLAARKSYRLVGVNKYGYNAVFVRRGLAERLLPEVDAAACLASANIRQDRQERIESVRQLEWTEV